MVETEKNRAEITIGPLSAGDACDFDMLQNKTISIVVIFLLIFFITQYSFAAVSNDIPLENPIYNNIDRLSNMGFIPDDIQSIRPITINRLQEIESELPTDPTLPSTVRHDIEQIKDFLSIVHKPDVLHESAEVIFLHTNAETSPMLQTDALVNPLLNSKDEGRFQSQSSAFRFQPRLWFDWQDWAAFEIQPVIAIENSTLPGFNENRIFLQTAQLKLGHGSFEFSVGRSRIQWGQGILGGLSFGGSQTPLDMFQIKNSSPVIMPSFLKYIGPTQFVLFFAKLDEHQVFPGSYVIGERAVIKPHPIVDVGFTQSIQLAGEGAPNLSTLDVASEIIGNRRNDINRVNFTNRNFAADVAMRIPVLWNTKIYSEVFFEDCCEFPLTRDSSKLIGILFPELFHSSGSLGLEFVHTTEIYNRHGRYTSGFINRGYNLGHPLGPDAEGYYLRYHHALPKLVDVDVIGAYEKRANGQTNRDGDPIIVTVPTFDDTEKRLRGMLKIQHIWKNYGWTSIQTGYERVQNFAYFDRDDRNNFIVRIDHGFSF